jgi:hypothetical protein
MLLLLPLENTCTKCEYVDKHIDKLKKDFQDVQVVWCAPRDAKNFYTPINALFLKEVNPTTIRERIGTYIKFKTKAEAAVVIKGSFVDSVSKTGYPATFYSLIVKSLTAACNAPFKAPYKVSTTAHTIKKSLVNVRWLNK